MDLVARLEGAGPSESDFIAIGVQNRCSRAVFAGALAWLGYSPGCFFASFGGTILQNEVPGAFEGWDSEEARTSPFPIPSKASAVSFL